MEKQIWKILLVEDDEDDYFLTKSLLQEAKRKEVNLTWKSTYETGLRTLDHDTFDVVLVDYRLGSRNGLDLIREVTARGCRTPMIILTGQGSYEVDLQAMESGAVDYLVKEQINGSILERTIRYAIERQQSQEALQRAHDELEMRVHERTQELGDANVQLMGEIAERTRAEAAVRESETKFRKLAETTSTAIFIVQNMKIRYANPAASRITGYTTDELVQKLFWEIAHPSYQNTIKENGLAGQWRSGLTGGLAEELPSRYELKVLNKSGEPRWVDVTAGSIEYQGEQAWVVTAFDITERDLAEQEVRTANEQLAKAKGELEVRVSERTAELSASNELLAKTNQQMTEANQLLKTVFETEPDGLAVLAGPELRFQFANPAFQALTPSPDIFPIGRALEEIWPTAEADGIYSILNHVYESGEPVYGARLHREEPDVASRHFSMHVTRLPWRDQTAILLVLWETTRVVEAQRKAEQATRDVQRQADELDAVFNAMTDALLIYDVEGIPLLVNPAAIRLFGNELTQKNHLQFAHDLQLHNPDGTTISDEELPVTRALEGKTVTGQTIAFTDPQGKKFVCMTSASPLAQNDSHWGVVVIMHDVSERESLLAQIAFEQARLKAIIDNAPEGIVVVDKNCRIILANPTAEAIYSRPVPLGQDYMNHSGLEIYDPDGKPYVARQQPLVRSALDGDVNHNLEAAIYWPDGQKRNILINSSPIWETEGSSNGAVCIFQDITERKIESENMLRNLSQLEVQRRLIQHRETERLVIAQELHDVSLQGLIGLSYTMNESIVMSSNFLEKKAIRSDEGESLLSKLNVIRVILEQQIQDLRSFCSELRPPTLAPFGLEKAIRSYLESFHRKHPKFKIEASLMPDSRVLPEDTRLALFRIFQELLNNIVRHSKADQITINFTLNANHAELMVSDNGLGFISPAQWVEFAREGHLGLVGARERAEAVGGIMKVTSQPGAGTQIQVVVPISHQ